MGMRSQVMGQSQQPRGDQALVAEAWRPVHSNGKRQDCGALGPAFALVRRLLSQCLAPRPPSGARALVARGMDGCKAGNSAPACTRHICVPEPQNATLFVTGLCSGH